MYRVYRTPAFILVAEPHGEANKIYTMLTRDLGVLRVFGQGVRRPQAKHRGHLADRAPKEVCVIRGKEWWRLTTIRDGEEEQGGRLQGSARMVFGRIAAVITLLVHGEEPAPELYAIVHGAWYSLLKEEEGKHKAIETIAVGRMLAALGFMSDFREQLMGEWGRYDQSVYEWVEEHRKPLITSINQALREARP
jgi:recombinational DNA repair protein (RecF pathway)